MPPRDTPTSTAASEDAGDALPKPNCRLNLLLVYIFALILALIVIVLGMNASDEEWKIVFMV
jgi:hypothetical protein